MGLLKLLFILNIISLPLGEITRFNLGNGVAVTINDIGVLLLAIAWIVISLINNQKPRSLLIKPILFFIAIGILSLLINFGKFLTEESLTSSMYLIRWALYSSIYFIVSSFDNKFKKKILICLIISSILFLLIGYIQYFYYQSLKNLFYLGWDDHMYRLFSSFLDPNFSGSYVVLFLFLLITIFIYKSKFFSNFKKIIFLSLIASTFIALILTYSRGALIMFVTGSFLLLLLTKKIKFFYLISGLLIIIFIFLSKFFYIENINLFRSVSTNARITSIKEAIFIIQKNPIFGVGFNSYRYAQIKYGLRNGPGVLTSHADAGTDNSFLFVFATSGAIGLIAYLNIWRIVFLKSLKEISSKDQFSRIVSTLIVTSIIGIFINSLFINALFFPFIMEWLWILVGLRESK